MPFAPALDARVGLPGSEGQVSAEPPPLYLPGEHFAAALACLVLGAIALVEVAPELAAGVFFLPHVVAAVHLFTLGWIVLSIFGALCQFLPVAIGRRMRWERLVHVTFALQVVGLVGFVAGLADDRHGLVAAGAGLLTLAFVLFAVNLGATLAMERERSVTWWALAGACVFLVVTPIYGTVLERSLGDGSLGAARFQIVAVHAHVAIAGIVLPVIVGVAQRLIPMFLLSHGARESPAKVSVALLLAGAAVLAASPAAPVLATLAGALISAGLVAFVVQAVLFFRRRMRRRLDAGMRLVAVGLAGLLAATAIAPIALARGLADLHLLAAYFVVLLGAITMFIAGHYYKIVPFLIWYHRFGPLVGVREVPKVADLYSRRIAFANGALLVAGWLGLAAATWAGSAIALRAAAVVFVAGASVQGFAMARIARRRPA